MYVEDKGGHRPRNAPSRPGRARIVPCRIVALVAFVALFIAPAGSAQVPVDTETLHRLDETGTIAQRVVLQLGPTRWLWIAAARPLLYEERPIAGAYAEQRLVPRSPLEDLRHWFGCAAGPVVIGPMEPTGLHRRAFDPTAGGSGWSAFTETDGVRLESALDGTRWTGVFLGGPIALGRRTVIRPGTAWYTDAPVDVDDEPIEVLLATVPITVSDRMQRRSVHIAAAYGRARHPVSDTDDWLFRTPPVRSGGVDLLGVVAGMGSRALTGTSVLGNGEANPEENARGAPPERRTMSSRVSVEAWAQRSGYRPVRRAGQLLFVTGTPALNVSFRALAARTWVSCP